MELLVSLDDVVVGTLARPGRGDAVQFRIHESYRQRPARPVLGQCFEGKLDAPWPRSQQVPAFFANLLPEGALRRMIAETAGVGEDQDMRLLAHLGDDLPGAVRVHVQGDRGTEEAPSMGECERLTSSTAQLRFSLAGVQLKFSMVRDGKGLTLPVSGRGGDWIVKLPDHEFAAVPENEAAMMGWARASGIEVPPFELVPFGSLVGVPERRFSPTTACYAVRRFDRPEPGRRVHIEDFAQVFDIAPVKKYDIHNYESIARVVYLVCGLADLREFVRRLVFVVLSGNADAHHKNWSLLYADGRNARLSPAYDLVATVAYPEVKRTLALKFNKSREFGDVSRAGFLRLGGKLGLDPLQVAGWADEDLAHIMSTWEHARTAVSPELRAAVDAHHSELGRSPQSILRVS